MFGRRIFAIFIRSTNIRVNKYLVDEFMGGRIFFAPSSRKFLSVFLCVHIHTYLHTWVCRKQIIIILSSLSESLWTVSRDGFAQVASAFAATLCRWDETGVARWYIFKHKIQIWVNFWRVLQIKMLINYMYGHDAPARWLTRACVARCSCFTVWSS
jgi:hypothetical protein